MNELDKKLNELIDNQLGKDELDQFNKVIETDEEVLKKLRALRGVDNSLKKMEHSKAPAGINEKIMNVISSSKNVISSSSNKVFYSIISIFGLLSILIVSFSIGKTNSNEISEKFHEYSDSVLGSIKSIIPNFISEISGGILIAFGILTIVILSFISVFEAHKSFRKELDSFH